MYILLVLLSHSVLTPEQMEKQFAVKGPHVKALQLSIADVCNARLLD